MLQSIKDGLQKLPASEKWYPFVEKYVLDDKLTLSATLFIIIVVFGGLISLALSGRHSSTDSGSPTDNTFASSSPDSTSPTSSPDNFSEPNATPLPSASVSPSPSTTPSPTPSPSPNGQLDAGHSTFSANPSSLAADGTTSSVVTITLRDNNNNPLSGLAVSLTTSDNRAVFNPTATGSNVTDLSGHATFTMTSTNAGNDNINVTATTSSGTSQTFTNFGSVTFTAVSSPTPTVSPSATP